MKKLPVLAKAAGHASYKDYLFGFQGYDTKKQNSKKTGKGAFFILKV